MQVCMSCVYRFAEVCIHACIHVFVHACMYINTYMQTHTLTNREETHLKYTQKKNVCLCVFSNAWKNMHIHARKHAYMRARASAHTHTHTHTQRESESHIFTFLVSHLCEQILFRMLHERSSLFLSINQAFFEDSELTPKLSGLNSRARESQRSASSSCPAATHDSPWTLRASDVSSSDPYVSWV